MPSDAHAARKGRVGVIDAVRGFSVISMVLFHLCYDLTVLAGVDVAWFEPPLQDIWRASISWVFLFVAGLMCPLSRSNWRRALKYGAVALAIFAVTSLAAVDVPISFGIIFCMAGSTLLYAGLDAAGAPPRGYGAAAALFVAFVLALPVSRGYVGLGSLRLELPGAFYATDWLSWLGFPCPTFASGDYYPLLPYSLLFLAGAAVGAKVSWAALPQWAYTQRLRCLRFIGRHALEVYVAHQPLLLVLVELLA